MNKTGIFGIIIIVIITTKIKYLIFGWNHIDRHSMPLDSM